MKILLDTHALLWLFAGDANLGLSAREAMRDPANTILLSTASLWEIAVKTRTGKLEADLSGIIHHARRAGMQRLDIEPHHLFALQSLPALKDHRDPFDHLLIAQAIAEGAVLLSSDRRFSRYPVTVLPCGG